MNTEAERRRNPSTHRLAFDTPAREWTQALPLGNGHLGAMCFGDPGGDRFALNHDTLWSGSPHSERSKGVPSAEAAKVAIDRARAALAAKDYASADAAVRRLQGTYGQAYLPLGDLWLRRQESPRLLSRELDLITATHSTSCSDGTICKSYISSEDNVLVIETSFPNRTTLVIDFEHQLHELGRVVTDQRMEVHLRAPSDVAPHHEPADPPVSWSMDTGRAVEAIVKIAVSTDGRTSQGQTHLAVVDATSVRVILTCQTTFAGLGEELEPTADLARRRAAEQLEKAERFSADELSARHVTAHRALYDSFELSLGPDSFEVARANWGTEARVARARSFESPFSADPNLVSLLVHYGRYLLISSSRRGTLPATLQGIWNEDLRPPWSSNYTLNINTQMNYWGAEITGLSECHRPLNDLVTALAANGQETATRLYGTRGWVAHHNADAWAFTQPVGQGLADPAWAFWPMAGAWLVCHLVEQIRFCALDSERVRLAEELWPWHAGVVLFLRDWVQQLQPHIWGTPLSTSPENSFKGGKQGQHAAVARHSAMDAELIHEVARGTSELAKILGINPGIDPLCADAQWLLDHVPLPRTGQDGGVAEWFDDQVPLDPHHRHVSMLYGAFPGNRDLTEDERQAVSRSLDLRGDDSTGWSVVWKVALRARLHQADRVLPLLDLMARDASQNTADHAGGLYANLFAAHPPFQIDGNLGLIGAVLECLIQSHQTKRGLVVIEPLPALPSAWSSGQIKGVRLRAGLVANLRWSQGEVESLTLSAAQDTEVIIRSELEAVVKVPGGSTVDVMQELATIKDEREKSDE